MIFRGFALKTVIIILLITFILPHVSTSNVGINTANAQSSSAEIDDVTVRFDNNGVTFFVDATYENLLETELFVTIWIESAVEEGTYIHNRAEDEEYTNRSGYLYVYEMVEPRFTEEEITTELFIPYDQFPFVDYNYSYVPIASISYVSTDEYLDSERHSSQRVTVYGEEEIYGYRAFMSVREMNVYDTVEDFPGANDELIFIYQLSETTGEWDELELAGNEFKLYEFDMQADYGTAQKDDMVESGAFRWLEVYVKADRDLWVSFNLTEHPDNQDLLGYTEVLNSFVAGGTALAAPFLLTNPAGQMALAIVGAAIAIYNIGVSIAVLFDDVTDIGQSHERISPQQFADIAAIDGTWDRTYRYSDGDFDYEIVVSAYFRPFSRHELNVEE